MKISSYELLDLILIQSLKELPEKLILNYASGKTGLNFVDDVDFPERVALYSSERHLVTNKISKQQLLKRIRALIKFGFLIAVSNSDKSFFMYRLSEPKIKQAYVFAVNYWKTKGLSKDLPIKLDNLEQLCEELRNLLLEKFAGGEL